MRQRPEFAEVLYPGARDLLARLQRREDVRLGVATGKSRRGVDRLLETQGWRGLFATIQTADEHPSKPDPSMLRAALAESGIPAKCAAMVGDTTYDMAMAVAAHVRPIGVAWGYHDPAALLTSGAAAIAGDMDALETIAVAMDRMHG